MLVQADSLSHRTESISNNFPFPLGECKMPWQCAWHDSRRFAGHLGRVCKSSRVSYRVFLSSTLDPSLWSPYPSTAQDTLIGGSAQRVSGRTSTPGAALPVPRGRGVNSRPSCRKWRKSSLARGVIGLWSFHREDDSSKAESAVPT